MALACRVTRNAVMMAVIAHTVVLTTHPHPRSSPEKEGVSGAACIQNMDIYVYGPYTFTGKTCLQVSLDSMVLSVFW